MKRAKLIFPILLLLIGMTGCTQGETVSSDSLSVERQDKRNDDINLCYVQWPLLFLSGSDDDSSVLNSDDFPELAFALEEMNEEIAQDAKETLDFLLPCAELIVYQFFLLWRCSRELFIPWYDTLCRRYSMKSF